mmetsp:Transcript_34374/g.45467  ORF Transcript_34374/g.45467 Transcript_34374/m.45467 type:complete len:244 (-) Transcript_34374:465-1196(-)
MYLNIYWSLHREEITNTVTVIVRDDFIFFTEKLGFSCNSGEDKATLHSIVFSKQDVSIKSVTNHADSISLDTKLVTDVVNHQGRRLSDHKWLFACAPFDSANHGSVPCPLLSIREMGHSIQVGGNELAAFILIDAQLCVLNFIVVDVSVKAHNNSSNVRILINFLPRAESGNSVFIGFSTNVRNTDQIKLFFNSSFTNDINFFPCFFEPCLFKICCSCKTGRENFFWWHIKAKAVEFFLVTFS